MNNKYKLKITGKDPKRFIKDLIKEKIYIYHLENYDKYSIIIVDDYGYRTINKKKTSYKITLIREYGLIRYKNLLKKYQIFFISIIVGILLIKTLSMMVFDIKIEHSKEEIRDLILYDLEQLGIKKYYFKVPYDQKEKIKRKILRKETEKIEWLEIEEKGTKYIIKVEERIRNEGKEDNTPQHIVAKKNAMILSISAEKGEVKKKKYDYVKKGDVLISGIITRDDQPMTKTKAKGKVYGEVWYQVSVDVPKKYREIKKTNQKKKRLELKIGNKSIFFLSPKYKTYQVRRKTLIQNPILPISLNYSNIEETKEIKKDYEIENISKEAMEIGEKKLATKLKNKDRIISKKVLKKSEKNSRIEVEVFFKVKEDITDEESIKDLNLEKIKEGEVNESND